MNNPNAIVRTLHSLFGLSPLVDLTDGNYDLRQLKNVQRNKPQLKDNAVLIIDEASMISKGLFKFIEEYKNNHNVKIIYVGDDAQLSPVNDDSISPVFTGNQTKLQLTKVERTGDNAILAESTRLRNGEDFSYETRDNVEFTNSTDRANEVIDTIVNSEEFKTNPLYFRILSATNDMISDANNRVRRILFGDNAK
jgi:ATP-dependent exoDNAse (exonuclease V) alpha subunit